MWDSIPDVLQSTTASLSSSSVVHVNIKVARPDHTIVQKEEDELLAVGAIESIIDWKCWLLL